MSLLWLENRSTTVENRFGNWTPHAGFPKGSTRPPRLRSEKIPGLLHRVCAAAAMNMSWHRYRLVQMRARATNQLHVIALNEGLRRKKALWRPGDLSFGY